MSNLEAQVARLGELAMSVAASDAVTDSQVAAVEELFSEIDALLESLDPDADPTDPAAASPNYPDHNEDVNGDGVYNMLDWVAHNLNEGNEHLFDLEFREAWRHYRNAWHDYQIARKDGLID